MHSQAGQSYIPLFTTFWVSMRGVHLHSMRLWNFFMWPVTYAMLGVWSASHGNQRGVNGPHTLLVGQNQCYSVIAYVFWDWDTYSTVCRFAMNKCIPRPTQMYVQLEHVRTYSNLLISDTILRRSHCYRKLHRSISDVFCVLFPTIFPTTIKVTIWAYRDRTHGLTLAFSHPLEIVNGKAQHKSISHCHTESPRANSCNGIRKP